MENHTNFTLIRRAVKTINTEKLLGVAFQTSNEKGDANI